ncbi:hypothetical protein XENTR_v10010671 [Xenopus tropicalis]|eukprot:XP_012816738.1 PREDICTED: uncharacterized protein C11orf74 homolog isoform X2 [Xenopus tropicalis]
MPGSLPECPIMAEGDWTSDVLDRFISIPEQSYEQFLGTFSHLPKERRELQFGPVSVPEQQRTWERARTKDKEEDGNKDSTAKESEQVDNYLDPSPYETDNGDVTCSGFELLPGEAESEGPSYIPSWCRSTRLDFRTLPSCQETASTVEQTEEVQPFALEEGFDYDHVALTPKFSVSELKYLEMERHGKIGEEESTEQTEI